MANRQLFAVVLAVAGLGSFGCGKGDTSAAFDDPVASDEPPSNPDQPRSGTDQAPVNADQPQSNSDAPPGGGLGSLCVALCNRILGSECEGDNVFGSIREQGCDTDCVVPAALLPCERQLVDVFQCYLTLPTLCYTRSDGGDGQGQGQGGEVFASCGQVLEAYADCSDAYEPPKVEDSDSLKGCFPDGGCKCENACTTCMCENPADVGSCADTCTP